MARTLSNQSTA